MKPVLRVVATSIAACVFLFWPCIASGRPFIVYDSWDGFLPMRTQAFQMICHGQAPVWTESILGGYPLLSMAQNALGYPLTWGYLLNPVLGEQLYVLAPFLLTPLTMWIFLRRIGLEDDAALLGGLLFTYGGYVAGMINHSGVLSNASIWLPLTLYAVDASREGRFARCVAGGGLAYGMSVLNGEFQGFVYVGIIAVAYGAWLSVVTRSIRPLAGSVLMGIVAASLAGFQVMETLVAVGESARATNDAHFNEGAMCFRDVLTHIVYYSGRGASTTPGISILGLLLALASLARMPADRRYGFFVLLIPLSVVLMMGTNTPLYSLFRFIPLLRLIHQPDRWSVMCTFGLAVLGAYGWQAWIRPRLDSPLPALLLGFCGLLAGRHLMAGDPSVLWLAATALPLGAAIACLPRRWPVLVPILVVLATVPFGARTWRLDLIPVLERSPVGEPPTLNTAWLLAHKEVERVYTAFTPLWPQDMQGANRNARFGMREVGGYDPLIFRRYALALGNVERDAYTVFEGTPGDWNPFLPANRVLDLLSVTHVVSIENVFTVPTRWVPPTPLHEVTEIGLLSYLAYGERVPQGTAVADVIVIAPNGDRTVFPLRAGVDTADGAYARSRPIHKEAVVATNGWTNLYLARIPYRGDLSALEIRPYVWGKTTLYIDKIGAYVGGTSTLLQRRNVRFEPVFERRGLQIWRNDQALPRFWFVSRLESVNEDEALTRIRGLGQPFDPRQVALVEGADPLPPVSPHGMPRWALVTETPATITLDVETSAPTFLVASEIFYPGWEATVDGQPIPIYRTDYLLRGVPIQAGHHQLVMAYRAPAARLGMWISLATLGLILVMGASPRGDRRSRG